MKSIFSLSIGFCWAFAAIHTFALPLIVSTDGRSYIAMSEILFTEKFATDWNFHRTPLFPLLIRGSTEFLGFSADSIKFLNACLLAGGITFIGLGLRRFLPERLAGCVVLFLSLYPAFIGFAHNVLTEVGSFFFVSLIFYCTVFFLESLCLSSSVISRWSLISAFWLGLSISTGYYFRQSLLYLALPVLALVGVSFFLHWKTHSWKTFVLPVILMLGLAWLPPLVWKNYGGDKKFSGVVLSYGLIKQGVLPKNDPRLTQESRASYTQGLQELRQNGLSQTNGIPASLTTPIQQANRKWLEPAANSIVFEYPGRYLRGVARAFLYFLGLPGKESQIESWSNMAFTLHGTRVTGNHPQVSNRLQQTVGRSALAYCLQKLSPLYTGLLPLASCLTLATLLLALLRRERMYLILPILYFFFIFIHALSCMTVDRYVLPVYAFGFAHLFIFPYFLFQSLRGRKTL